MERPTVVASRSAQARQEAIPEYLRADDTETRIQAPPPMQLSDKGRAFMKDHEKLRLRIYDDGAPRKPWTGGKRRGTLTVGWGHTPMGAAKFDFEAHKNKAITEEQAQNLFDVDVAACVADVNRIVKVSLTQDQFDALVSRTYNMGPQNGSNLITLVNAGKLSEAAEALAKGKPKKGYGGLSKRRSDEAALWNGEPVEGGADSIPEFLRPLPSDEKSRAPNAAKVTPGGPSSVLDPKWMPSLSADDHRSSKSTDGPREADPEEVRLYVVGELLKAFAALLLHRRPNPEAALLIAQGVFGKFGKHEYLVPFLGKLTAYEAAPDLATAAALYLQTLMVLPVAFGVGGLDTMGVWWNYLDISQRAASRKPSRFPPGERVVEGFRNHRRTVAAEKGVLRIVESAVRQEVEDSQPLQDHEIYLIPLKGLDPEGETNRAIGRGGTLEMVFDDPMTIPGLLAGGVGSSLGKREDKREVAGHLLALVDRTNGTVLVTPHLKFSVEDTVDFRPGDLGDAKARTVTVPMSILEATGDRFGPMFATDVPLYVTFPGPGVASLWIVTSGLPRVQKGSDAARKPRKSGGKSK